MLNETKKEEIGEFIDSCRDIAWAKEEVEKWMAKQAVRCLRLQDNDRAS